MLRTLAKIGIGIAATTIAATAIRRIAAGREPSITLFGRKITGRPARLAHQLRDGAARVASRASEVAHKVGHETSKVAHEVGGKARSLAR